MKKSILLSLCFAILLTGALAQFPGFVQAQGEPIQTDQVDVIQRRGMMGGYGKYWDESNETQDVEESKTIKIMLALAHIFGIVTWVALIAFLVSGTRYYWHETRKNKSH